jgi:hypothetical protein
MARPTISQRIALVGSEEVKRAFAELGKAGEEAFAQLQRSSTGLRQGLEQVSGAIQRFSRDEAAMQNLGQAAEQVRTGFSDTGSAITGFVGTVAAAGVSAAAAVPGIVALGRSVLNTATAANSAATLARRNIQLESSDRTSAVQTALQHETAVKALGKQYAEGAIDITQYSKGLQDLTERQREQERQSRIMRAVRAAEAEEQARAQAELQRRQALEQLQARFGAQLTSSLIRLGSAAEQVRREFIQTFGPAVASLVDGISGFIERNRGALTGLFQDIQRQFSALGGDAQFASVLQTMLDLARQAAGMITGALIPAFQTFIGFLDRVAALINAAFGTEMTGKQILMAGIILKLAGVFGIVSGAVRSVFAVLSLLVALFGPWGLAIAGVIAALTLLATVVDWQRLLSAAKGASMGSSRLPGHPGARRRFLHDSRRTACQPLGRHGGSGDHRLEWLCAVLRESGGTLSAIASSIAIAITSAFNSAVDAGIGAFQRMYQSIAGFFDRLISQGPRFGERRCICFRRGCPQPPRAGSSAALAEGPFAAPAPRPATASWPGFRTTSSFTAPRPCGITACR